MAKPDTRTARNRPWFFSESLESRLAPAHLDVVIATATVSATGAGSDTKNNLRPVPFVPPTQVTVSGTQGRGHSIASAGIGLELGQPKVTSGVSLSQPLSASPPDRPENLSGTSDVDVRVTVLPDGSEPTGRPVKLATAYEWGTLSQFTGNDHSQVTIDYSGSDGSSGTVLSESFSAPAASQNNASRIETHVGAELHFRIHCVATSSDVLSPPNKDGISYFASDSDVYANLSFLLVDVDYVARSLDWDTERGPDKAAQRRGLDFKFDVVGTNVLPDIEFDWVNARGDTVGVAQPATPASQFAVIDNSPKPSDQVGTQYVINAPAHWKMPPVDARGIKAILDPADRTKESSESNNMHSVDLHSSDEIMRNSVKPRVSNHSLGDDAIYADFLPGSGSGKSFTMSEAEVAMGVDHFNWMQQIVGKPANWHSVILDGYDTSRPISTPVKSVDGTFTLRYEDKGNAIPTIPISVPEIDPIVEPPTVGPIFKKCIIVERVTENALLQVNTIDIGPPPGNEVRGFPDEFEYYWNEPASTYYVPKRSGNVDFRTQPNSLEFFDQPTFPKLVDVGESYTQFNTQLVGVLDSNSNFKSWHDEGWLTNFTWSSNSVYSLVNITLLDSKGEIPPPVVYNAAGGDSPPPSVGGGIYDVRFDDGTFVPGFPTAAPSLLPDLAKKVSLSGFANGWAAPLTADSFLPAAPDIVAQTPFPDVDASVRSVMADVDGDGVPDTVAVTGPGVPIRLTVLSGKDGSVLVPPFDPFGGDFTGGGFVAAADIDNDGRAEFVVTPDEGGGPRVSVFSLASGAAVPRANFFGIDDPNFRGGARASLGDVNGDGVPDLLTAAGFGGGPRVALFDGATVFGTPTRLVNDFFAFPDDAATLRNGVFATLGDVDGDGCADLVFGGGPGGGPRVYVLSGLKLLRQAADLFSAPIANFFVGGNAVDRGGVHVAAKDLDGDGLADLVVGSGDGSPPAVRAYFGKSFVTTDEPAAETLQLPDSVPFSGGVYVG